jgi:hypothetical protein
MIWSLSNKLDLYQETRFTIIFIFFCERVSSINISFSWFCYFLQNFLNIQYLVSCHDTQNNDTQHDSTQPSNTQHNNAWNATFTNTIVLLCWVSYKPSVTNETFMLSVVLPNDYSECHNAECHNAECHNTECHNAEYHYAEWVSLCSVSLC